MADEIKSIPFDAALSLDGPPVYNLMIKPAGSRCNLSCEYCYYLCKEKLQENTSDLMDDATLERVIRSYLETCDNDTAVFTWHGGEPALCGIPFYRRVLELEIRYAGGRKIQNCFQTNATLIDDGWASFLADNAFLVGVSIDGPGFIHDRYRRDRASEGSLERALKGVDNLHRHGAEYNIMATINKASEGHGRQTYRFLKTLGTPFIQFSPVAELLESRGAEVPSDRKRPLPAATIAPPDSSDARPAPWNVSASGFGEFLCEVFDEWVQNDVGTVFVNVFDAVLSNLCGLQPGVCSFAPWCGGNLVVGHDGRVWPCDHFVYPGLALGDVRVASLGDLASSAGQFRFGQAKRDSLPEACRECAFLTLCNGGCPKHRFAGNGGVNVLCEGYRMFFRHSLPLFTRMKNMLESQNP